MDLESLLRDRNNWDKALMLADEDTTLAEVTEESLVDVWNKNFIAIAKEVSKHPND